MKKLTLNEEEINLLTLGLLYIVCGDASPETKRKADELVQKLRIAKKEKEGK